MTDDALIEELARAMCMSLKGPSWQSYIAAARFILPMIRHERNETQAAEIKTILDREADTHRRHDAKVDALETALREVLADAEALMDITWRKRAYAALGKTK